LEADRDYGTGFMASKRKQAQKPLKVREPLARYVLRGKPPVRLDRGRSPYP